MNDKQTILLTHQDIARIVSLVGSNEFMREMIQQLSKAMVELTQQGYEIPARSGFQYQQPTCGLMEWMTLHKKSESVFLKAVGYHPSNPQTNRLPTIVSTLSQFDPQTGQLRIIADGALLTAMRTGAASAVATDYLATADASELGLVGCGTQAVTQLHAVSLVRDLRRVRVYDVDQSVADSFADRVAPFCPAGVHIEAMSLQDVIEQSEIICTATSIAIGDGPLFDGFQLQRSVHVNAVGSDFPGKVELPKSLLENSMVCPDFLAQAKCEGECQQLSTEQIGPSITEVVSDPKRFEKHKRRSTVFDSTGWALEDHVALQLALKHATKHGIGAPVQLDALQDDPWNPYQQVFQATTANS